MQEQDVGPGRAPAGAVVVGVDGTEGSDGALAYAVDAASRGSSLLLLVHVVPGYVPVAPSMPYLPEEMLRAGHQILEQAQGRVAELAPGLRVDSVLRHGSRLVELVEISTGAGLLVIGQESRSTFERLVVGGTTAAVAAHSRAPVVVVPADWQPGEVGEVVAGVKGEENAETLLDAAFALAEEHGARVRLVHTWWIPEYYAGLVEASEQGGAWQANGEGFVGELADRWRERHPGVEVAVDILNAEPGPGLVAASREAGVVVLARRRPPRFLGPHLGRTARAVLRGTECPVLVLPSPDERGGSGTPAGLD